MKMMTCQSRRPPCGKCVMYKMKGFKETHEQTSCELPSKCTDFRCWESRYRSGERSSGGRNTQVGGHCGEKAGVPRGKATIAASYSNPLLKSAGRCTYIDITRFNNNNNCLLGTSRFLQHRVSLRFQFPPPPCGGKSIFLMYFAVPQSQPSRPLTLRHITFVEPGLPLLLPDARKYFLASSDSQALGCLTGWADCLTGMLIGLGGRYRLAG